MSKIRVCLTFCVSLLLLALAAPASRAQMPQRSNIKADVSHPFIVGNTKLPAGHYDLHMISKTDQKLMEISSANGSTSVEFLVRPKVDSNRPAHSELVFNRYGKTEILKDIYVGGEKSGVAVVTPSREEARLQKQGMKADPHTEVENQ